MVKIRELTKKDAEEFLNKESYVIFNCTVLPEQSFSDLEDYEEVVFPVPKKEFCDSLREEPYVWLCCCGIPEEVKGSWADSDWEDTFDLIVDYHEEEFFKFCEERGINAGTWVDVGVCRCGKHYLEGYRDDRCDETFCSKECADEYHGGDL